ncbi:hypothetical protein B0I35DRAFT_433252 [Stachybotrys elegans]|uniref:Uncharacterized protein n=1 Tax=Stachybotrys elegans TaxID=80388 RepID=A0A8K0SM03_9HYPO|nr:hypothetical protein B0I35DRAFT_433252 [Stachybotrys elegans]
MTMTRTEPTCRAQVMYAGGRGCRTAFIHYLATNHARASLTLIDVRQPLSEAFEVMTEALMDGCFSRPTRLPAHSHSFPSSPDKDEQARPTQKRAREDRRQKCCKKNHHEHPGRSSVKVSPAMDFVLISFGQGEPVPAPRGVIPATAHKPGF